MKQNKNNNKLLGIPGWLSRLRVSGYHCCGPGCTAVAGVWSLTRNFSASWGNDKNEWKENKEKMAALWFYFLGKKKKKKKTTKQQFAEVTHNHFYQTWRIKNCPFPGCGYQARLCPWSSLLFSLNGLILWGHPLVKWPVICVSNLISPKNFNFYF